MARASQMYICHLTYPNLRLFRVEIEISSIFGSKIFITLQKHFKKELAAVQRSLL